MIRTKSKVVISPAYFIAFVVGSGVSFTWCLISLLACKYTQFPTMTLFPDVTFLARCLPLGWEQINLGGLAELFYPLSNANDKMIKEQLCAKTIYLGVQTQEGEDVNETDGRIQLSLFRPNKSIQKGNRYI